MTPFRALFALPALALLACSDKGDTGGKGEGGEPACTDPLTFYTDADGDGYGDAAAPIEACEQPEGATTDATDCSDSDAAVHVVAEWYEDADGDGYGRDSTLSSQCEPPENGVQVGGDCDDVDAATSPEGVEVCDEWDNDCDGLQDDEDDSLDLGTANTYYMDTDYDGYGDASAPVVACERPAGTTVDSTDCDDTSAEIGDPIDYYPDADGDGYGDPSAATPSCTLDEGFVADNTDCDDSSELAFPGNLEVCADGLDNDCDGSAECLVPGMVTSEAAASFIGAAEDEDLGLSVALVDANGDGTADVLVNSSISGAAIWFGPVSGENLYADASAHLTGESISTVASAGDINSDGHLDLVVADRQDSGVGSSAGSLWLVMGPVTGDVDLATQVEIQAESAGDYAGGGLLPAGDINGDGNDDLLVGAFREATGGVAAGAAYLLLGPITTSGDLDDADTTWRGAAAFEELGRSFAAPGDVDGDGMDDLLLGAPSKAYNALSATAYFVPGPADESGDIDVVGMEVGPSGGQQMWGTALAGMGDLNADGYADFAIGAARGGDNGQGAVYLFHGPITAATNETAAVASITTDTDSFAELGSALVAEDANEDGDIDLIIGTPRLALDSGGEGLAQLFFGPIEGLGHLASEADATIESDTDDDRLAATLASGGDATGDGHVDLLLGAPQWSSTTGRAFLWQMGPN